MKPYIVEINILDVWLFTAPLYLHGVFHFSTSRYMK